MLKRIILFAAIILFFLNILCWKEVFVLAAGNNLKVDFLDVGQGDSAFIETPGMNKILIDGGPDSTVLGKLAENMPLWDKEIDLVILTHPESDHMQGLIDALKVYRADYILWTGVEKKAPEYTAWMDVLQRQKKMGSKIIIAKDGQEIKAGNVLIDTLYPFSSLEGYKLTASANDTCVVSHLVYGKNSFLFTGDLSSKGEAELVDAKSDITSDVLKVGHHGSKTSTSDLFLQNVKPKVAVIEVGKNNPYGHPTAEVLQRLEKFGIKVFRTDKDGDVKFVSDGNVIKLLTN